VLPPDGVRTVQLTPREYEVLVGLDEGLRIKQLARAPGISEATAKAHARSLFRKLDATSRAEATRAARRLGLLHA
jgi:DNA-binding NarL/FixJ family response regulator